MVAVTASENIEAYGLSLFTEKDASGLPVVNSELEESIAGTFERVSLLVGDDLDKGVGTLFITTRRVIWLAPSIGVSVDFQNINMHAISRSTETGERPCIYAQLEPGVSDRFSEGDDEEEEVSAEIRLIPEDPEQLQDIFKVLCDSAALNPDPDQEDDDGQGDFFFNEEEVLAGAGGEQRAALLEQYDALLSMPRADELDELVGADPERFEDADEDYEEEEEETAPGDKPSAQ